MASSTLMMKISARANPSTSSTRTPPPMNSIWAGLKKSAAET